MGCRGRCLPPSLLSLLVLAAAAVQSCTAAPPKGCRRSCKGVDLPYPFGIIGDPEGCYMLPDFGFACDDSADTPIYMNDTIQMPVVGVSLSQAYMRAMMFLSWQCYNSSGPLDPSVWGLSMAKTPYTMSYTRNTFTAVGCDTAAMILIGSNNNYGGCITGCNSLDNAVDGQCSGVGCCESTIPPGIKWYNASFGVRSNSSRAWTFNNCSYSFLAEKGNYTFHRKDIVSIDTNLMLPQIMEWVVANESCAEARKNSSSYACVSSNSECVDSSNGPGYYCNCTKGFEGNPYLEGEDGCQDIDECKMDRKEYPCFGTCINTQGGYNCTCPYGYESTDAKKTECLSSPSSSGLSLAVKLLIGIGSGVAVVVIISLTLCLGIQRRNIRKLREKCFQKNGGVFLRQALSTNRGAAFAFRIFSMDEVEKATQKFDRKHVLGKGGHGTVYRGVLDDGRVVAIKRASVANDRSSRDFANELVVLSEINHRNIVKLLGCCLDDEVPMLVYEFVPGGTLFQRIHGATARLRPFPFASRLKVAVEAAEALKYLHSDASPPILHGDVKSSNVLLDGGGAAKVSDFGTSILAPKDMSQFTTFIQGTYGYLDPEYLVKGCLTDRSDVFSFGVMLAELLTGKLPFIFSAPDDRDRCLAVSFAACARGGEVAGMLDPEIGLSGSGGAPPADVIKVAEIALQCLRARGEHRPSMKEVAVALAAVASGGEALAWAQRDSSDGLSEMENLLSAGATNEFTGTISEDDFEIQEGR